jgi:hypothetical protein
MMNQGIQATIEHDVIRKSGCYFLTLLKWLELEDGMSFNEQRILDIYKMCADANFIIDSNAFVKNAVSIVNLALGYNKYQGMRRDIKEKPDGLCIVALTRPSGGSHFILDDNGTTWDSLPPDRPAAATWSPDSYRLLVV